MRTSKIIENDVHKLALSVMLFYQEEGIFQGRLQEAMLYLLSLDVIGSEDPRHEWMKICKQLADMADIGPLAEFTH